MKDGGRRAAWRIPLMMFCLSTLAACVTAPVASYEQRKHNYAGEPYEVLIVDRTKFDRRAPQHPSPPRQIHLWSVSPAPFHPGW
jgi:hypothetical protein